MTSRNHLPASNPSGITRKQRRLLLLTAATSSACSLAIELLLGTLASYLVGNQALAYGVSIGGFLAAMGLGAYLSQYVAVETGEVGWVGLGKTRSQQLQIAFAALELCLAPLSALLPLALFALFVFSGPFWLGLISRIQSPYQRIVLTLKGQDLRLFLDGELQFSTLDEYRYHEALVHPAMMQVLQTRTPPRRVLLMGAGDGLALREVLKWPDLERVLLIDLDPAVVALARQQPLLVAANEQSLSDPRVELIFGDAFMQVPRLTEQFDVIIADFPDPDRDVIAKLYSQGFYRRLLPLLSPGGVVVTQASSSFFSPLAFACIAATLDSVGLVSHPYTVDVPSFGPWGFVLATPAQSSFSLQAQTLPISTRFLTAVLLSQLFELPKDVPLGGVEINRLVHPVITRYQMDSRWMN